MPTGQTRQFDIMEADFLLNVRAGQELGCFVLKYTQTPVDFFPRHPQASKCEREKPPASKSRPSSRAETSQEQPEQEQRLCWHLPTERLVVLRPSRDRLPVGLAPTSVSACKSQQYTPKDNESHPDAPWLRKTFAQ